MATTVQQFMKNAPQANKGTHLFLLYIISLYAWAPDFRSIIPGQGIYLQAPMMIVYVSTFLAIIFSAQARKISWRPLSFPIFASGLFLSMSAIIGAIQGQDLQLIFTNIMPTTLFMSTTLSTYILFSTKNDHKILLDALKTICLAFIVCHVIVATAIFGFNLSTSRYQFLSGASVPALAIFVLGAFLRFGAKDILIAAANLLAVLVSVTRTQLAIGAAQAVLCIAVAPSVLFRPSTFKKVFGLALLVLSIIAIDLASGTGLTDRWIERLTISDKLGADPTKLTRIAEDNFMWQEFTGSIQGFFIGHGLAAPTSLIGPEAALAGSLVGFGSVEFHSNGFGHNNYLSLLFIGGLLIGGPLLIVLISNGISALRLVRELLKSKKQDATLVYIGLWSSLIILGMLCEGLFSGTFEDRSSCLWYGIGTGMFYWVRKEIRRSTAATSKET